MDYIPNNLERVGQAIIIQPTVEEKRFTKMLHENKKLQKQLDETRELLDQLLERVKLR